MQIYISEEAIVADIQDKFNKLYPFLKLEFFCRPQMLGMYSLKDKLSPDTPIEKVRMYHSFGWLDVSDDRTAAAVEHDCSSLFGLCVHILPASGSNWDNAADSDNRTLEELNTGALHA
ncbi:hypothetical protein ACDQ55_09560 [Chitinophaga sp. 30R24]|uniref:hypothetical protein n=1 Tax=Chitinophaga sp. 30R24 TaxID=3248838 RepID=UPI003B8EF2F8